MTRATPVRLGMAATLVLVGLSGCFAWLDPQPPETVPGEARGYFDVFSEGNLPTWWAASVLLVGGLACVAVALLSVDGRERARWMALAALLLLLSIDEATVLHERLDRFATPYVTAETFPYLWVLPGAVVATGVVACVIWAAWTAPPAARGRVIAGILLLLGSALVGELVQGLLVTSGRADWPFVLTYHLEEAGETLGAVIVTAGVLKMLSIRRDVGRVTVDIRRQVSATRPVRAGQLDGSVG